MLGISFLKTSIRSWLTLNVRRTQTLLMGGSDVVSVNFLCLGLLFFHLETFLLALKLMDKLDNVHMKLMIDSGCTTVNI